MAETIDDEMKSVARFLQHGDAYNGNNVSAENSIFVVRNALLHIIRDGGNDAIQFLAMWGSVVQDSDVFTEKFLGELIWLVRKYHVWGNQSYTVESFDTNNTSFTVKPPATLEKSSLELNRLKRTFLKMYSVCENVREVFLHVSNITKKIVTREGKKTCFFDIRRKINRLIIEMLQKHDSTLDSNKMQEFYHAPPTILFCKLFGPFLMGDSKKVDAVTLLAIWERIRTISILAQVRALQAFLRRLFKELILFTDGILRYSKISHNLSIEETMGGEIMVRNLVSLGCLWDNVLSQKTSDETGYYQEFKEFHTQLRGISQYLI